MKRRIRKQHIQRDSNIRYTFHSYGTQYSFDPYKIISDDRIVNEANYFEKMTQLDFYKNEVRMSNEPHVYILSNTGTEVPV